MNNITFKDVTEKMSVSLSQGSGGSEVTKQYVDVQDALTLDSAKEYADTKAYDDTELKAQLADKANQADIDNELDLKQDKLTAGANITIKDGVISATGGGGATYDDTEVRGLIADNTAAIATKANKSDIPTVPTKTSQLTNDSGFLTTHQDISGLATKTELSDGLADKVSKETGKGLFSGNYNDLTDKPVIPSPYDDTAVRGLITANSALIATKADSASVYTKAEIDDKLGDVETALADIIGG